MPTDRIVSIGFLTEADLKMLGSNFDRHFPVAYDDLFAELIEQLDTIEASPLGKGVVLRPMLKDG